MGIPKFFSDLQPYNNTICLGTSSNPNVPAQSWVVIDGPSLVYCIYYRLLTSSTSQRIPQAASLSYRQICFACSSFLAELERHGVEIQHIYFDGGLPRWKKPIRLQRLERSLADLNTFRQSHPQSVEFSTVHGDTASLESAIWRQQSIPIPSKTGPVLPFMVAAVKEYLSSKYRTRVTLVPGEADIYCAADAKKSGLAILSSDSDLAAFEIKHGSVVWMNSVEKVTSSASNSPATITAHCIKPAHLAKSLGIKSLQVLAFERYVDPSASFAIIRHRARTSNRPTDPMVEDGWAAFVESYHIPVCLIARSTELQLLDPRLSEIVTASISPGPDNTERHIYFPMLLEDPTRDASWAYGTLFRALTYSLLVNYRDSSQSHSCKSVIEHYRKGLSISAPVLPIANISSLLQSAFDALATHTTHSQTSTANGSETLKWWSFALNEVQKRKAETSKPPLTAKDVWRLFRIPQGRSELAWEVIHLHANVHAVLYSFRMLKQALGVVLSGERLTGTMRKTAVELARHLQSLPSIPELHFTPAEVAEDAARVSASYLEQLVHRATSTSSPAPISAELEGHGAARPGKKPRRPSAIPRDTAGRARLINEDSRRSAASRNRFEGLLGNNE